MDLLRFLGKGEARVGARTRLFIGTSGNYRVGVVADAVHLLGVTGGSTAQEAMALINFTKLLQSARQRAVVR